jgi:hypothetical protein
LRKMYYFVFFVWLVLRLTSYDAKTGITLDVTNLNKTVRDVKRFNVMFDKWLILQYQSLYFYSLTCVLQGIFTYFDSFLVCRWTVSAICIMCITSFVHFTTFYLDTLISKFQNIHWISLNLKTCCFTNVFDDLHRWFHYQ